MTGRPAPGRLDWRLPDCTVCGTECDGDRDDVRCNDCGIGWANGEPGQWDGSGPACGHDGRCERLAGHDHDHAGLGLVWGDR